MRTRRSSRPSSPNAIASIFVPPRSTPMRTRSARLARRQREHERRAARGVAVEREIAPHAAREIAADREPEPRAFVSRGERAPELHERLEHLLPLLGRDADARIDHAQ